MAFQRTNKRFEDSPMRRDAFQYMQSLQADDENEESSRSKRGRWLDQQAEYNTTSTSLINFDFNRPISSSPYPSPGQHLLCLGNKAPTIAADAADLELSIQASTSTSKVQTRMGDLNSCSFNGTLQASSTRRLNPNHQNELIARLLAAASATSSTRESNAQALHRWNHGGQLGVPNMLAYNVQQGKQHTGISNQGLAKVNPSSCISQLQAAPLRDHDIMPNTTLIKPYNGMIKGTLVNVCSCNDRTLHNTTIQRKALQGEAPKEEDLFKKGAMQKFVKVVMEGRSIERKVCLEDYDSYESLAKALFDMYVGSPDDKHLVMNLSHTPINPSLHNVIPGYKIAYLDHEGDLLLAGDLPWREFTQVAKQIKILPMLKPKQHLAGA